MKVKILFLSANPHLDLNLDEEYKSIGEAINKGKYRDNITLLNPKLAVNIDNFIQAMNSEEPHIVHFAGHGTEYSKLLIMDESGKADELLSKEALSHLFKTLNDNPKLVFLNEQGEEHSPTKEQIEKMLTLCKKRNQPSYYKLRHASGLGEEYTFKDVNMYSDDGKKMRRFESGLAVMSNK